MRADFWDVVRVSETSGAKQARSKLGYVAGIGEEEGNPVRGIGIWIYEFEEVWSIDEEDLILLGHKDEVARADYRRRSCEGPHVRVRVDPETGEGFIVD